MRQFDSYVLQPVHSIEDFVARITEIKASHNATTWYRGHSKDDFRLVPTIGREYRYNGKKITFTPEQERDLLHRFRRRIYPNVRAIACRSLVILDDFVIPCGLQTFVASVRGGPS